MTHTSRPETREVEVREEMDVVALRQEVRMLAQALGLGLTQQARVTAATSAVARGLLLRGLVVTYQLRLAEHDARRALEVSCAPPHVDAEAGEAELEEQLNIHDARLLVDEVQVARVPSGARLTLRSWL